MAANKNGIISLNEVAEFRRETRGCAHVNHLNNAGARLMPDMMTHSIQEHIELEAAIGEGGGDRVVL